MITMYGYFIKDFERAEKYTIRQLETYINRIIKMREVE
nr:MAG TPA: hypothetical protein [Caudoviricetes sp.]DAS77295.1 MAG TPA: hypothetical protein [Caudoviricetes sp.]